MMWLRQMAQLSTTMSQAQRATAFHYVQVVSTCPAKDSAAKYSHAHLLNFEALLGLDITALLLSHGGCISHVDVGHDVSGGMVGGVDVWCGVLQVERSSNGLGSSKAAKKEQTVRKRIAFWESRNFEVGRADGNRDLDGGCL